MTLRCESKSKRSFLLVPAARCLGAGAPAWALLSCFAKKVSKEGDPTKHESPCAADNRVGGGRDWLVPRSLAETPPRLFLTPACFKGRFKPCAMCCDKKINGFVRTICPTQPNPTQPKCFPSAFVFLRETPCSLGPKWFKIWVFTARHRRYSG
jgi:hypothetical protein